MQAQSSLNDSLNLLEFSEVNSSVLDNIEKLVLKEDFNMYEHLVKVEFHSELDAVNDSKNNVYTFISDLVSDFSKIKNLNSFFKNLYYTNILSSLISKNFSIFKILPTIEKSVKYLEIKYDQTPTLMGQNDRLNLNIKTYEGEEYINRQYDMCLSDHIFEDKLMDENEFTDLISSDNYTQTSS